MELNARIRWAAVYGGCFLFSCIAIYAISAFFRMVWLEAMFYVLFLGLLALTVRGFAYVAKKTRHRQLEVFSRTYMLVLVLLLLVIGADILTSNFQLIPYDSFTYYAVPYLVVLPILCAYIIGPIGIGYLAYSIRESYPAAIAVSASAAIWFLYAIYFFGFTYLLNVSPPEFLGVFISEPVPEALFVAASMWLFFQASER